MKWITMSIFCIYYEFIYLKWKILRSSHEIQSDDQNWYNHLSFGGCSRSKLEHNQIHNHFDLIVWTTRNL